MSGYPWALIFLRDAFFVVMLIITLLTAAGFALYWTAYGIFVVLSALFGAG